MQRTELRRQVRLLRERMREARRELRARVGEIPLVKAARERRARNRKRALAASSLLLLLLLLLDCSGGPGTRAIAKATPSPKPTATAKPKQTPLVARLEKQKRPGYTLDAREGPGWLDEFRLQVAARSPRLSECFNGSERSGTLRWSVSIDGKSGAVADHDFEPIGGSADLTTEQLVCAANTLSKPPYLLKNAPAEALPNRVSLIVEF